MSTIEDVRAAEKKLQDIVQKLKKMGADDPNCLTEELNKVTEAYAKAVRELKVRADSEES